MGRSRYRFIDVTQPHFMTCTVLHWIPVFTRPETVEILLDSLRHLSTEGLKVYAYVILENHLHIIAQSDQLDRDMARFKSHTARQVLNYLEEKKVRMVLDQLAWALQAFADSAIHEAENNADAALGLWVEEKNDATARNLLPWRVDDRIMRVNGIEVTSMLGIKDAAAQLDDTPKGEQPLDVEMMRDNRKYVLHYVPIEIPTKHEERTLPPKMVKSKILQAIETLENADAYKEIAAYVAAQKEKDGENAPFGFPIPNLPTQETTMLTRLDIRKGDYLMSINGIPMDDVDRMLEVLRELWKELDEVTLKEVTVAVQRGYKKRLELHLNIEST